jgi:hypothetical protein
MKTIKGKRARGDFFQKVPPRAPLQKALKREVYADIFVKHLKADFSPPFVGKTSPWVTFDLLYS